MRHSSINPNHAANEARLCCEKDIVERMLALTARAKSLAARLLRSLLWNQYSWPDRDCLVSYIGSLQGSSYQSRLPWFEHAHLACDIGLYIQVFPMSFILQ